jgi:hypothetical protein
MSNTILTPTVAAVSFAGATAGNYPSSGLLYVSEFQTLLNDASSGSLLPRCPPVATQLIPFGAWPAVSLRFSPSTRLIRVQANGICAVAIGGAAPVATTAGQRMTSGLTEYFAVTPGDQLGVIATT